EVAVCDPEQPCRRRSGDRRVARLVREQCHLADEVAGADRGDLPLPLPRDVEAAVDDDEELMTGLPLPDHDLAGFGFDLLGRPRDLAEILLRALREQGDALE